MIDLLPTQEQQALVDATRAFLEAELPLGRLHEIAESGQGFDRAFWRGGAEQGWYGLGLPADIGGVGYSLVEEALLFRELGRFLTPGPILGTVLAAKAAAGPAPELAGSLIDGSAIAGLAEIPSGDDRAVGWWAGEVDVTLVVDLVSGTASVFDATGLHPGGTQPTFDAGYGLTRIEVDRLGDPLLQVSSRDLMAQGVVLVAAMLTGVAEATRDMGAAYAAARQQFGRPIGAFQAVKHRAADTALRAEAAWSQVAVAAIVTAQQRPDAMLQAASAKVVAADAAICNSRDTIQNHGAIGFTMAHDCHRYLTRAHVLDRMLGDSPFHLDTVVRFALDEAM